jgi:non-specific serine/threonine protein kinase
MLSHALTDRGMNLVYLGDLPAGNAMMDEAISLGETVPEDPFAEAIAEACRAVGALAAGDPGLADALYARAIEVCRAHGDQWWKNIAHAGRITAAMMLGDSARAAGYGRESLLGSAALGDTLCLTIALETMAWAAGADGDHHRAARLLGASARQATLNGGNPYHAGEMGRRHDQWEATARAALGDARFDAEYEAGVELPLEDAIAFARGESPPKKAPRAPRCGEQPLLTKREYEIAQLIADGLSNKQIANQLVISQRTAESHVEHVLAKLGLATRTQVASWIFARRN